MLLFCRYKRYDIPDQSDFVAIEIARTDDDTEGSYTSDSCADDDSSSASDSDSFYGRGAQSSAISGSGSQAPAWDDTGLSRDSPRSERSDHASRQSSFTSEISPDMRLVLLPFVFY